MKSASLVLLVVALFVGWSSFYIVDETEIAMLFQLGNPRNTKTEPGIYFKLPFIENVETLDGRIMGSDTPPAEYLTLDKKRLVADPITRWRITEPLKFYKTVHDSSGAKARIDDIINSELRRELASHNFGDIVGNARDPMMQRVATNVRSQTKEFGLEIVDVRIKRADLPREVQESVFARMRAERDRVAKKYRSEGEEESQKIKAETNKEKTIILAEAYESSQKTRGAGDADSIKIYAEAYGQDPEFYSFLRRLETYERSMGDKSHVVLSTGSDLFKYLTKPNK